jgi:tRNA (mo5U34)-methyltransferase
LRRQGLGRWAQQLESECAGWLRDHGDYARWSAALESLPAIDAIEADFNAAAVTVAGECSDSPRLRQALQGLMPWRKGPWQIADVYIDSEWRSDFKW